MKIMTFNANGIRSAARKGFFEWFHQQNIDILCLQETKASLEQLKKDPVFFPEGYYCHYVDAEKSGYSGVAIYSRIQPLSVVSELGVECFDREARYLAFEYSNYWILSLYFPSGTTGEPRQTMKYLFLNAIETHITELRSSQKKIILCGDFNIAHRPLDLKNWKGNQKNSGFLPEERAWIDKLFTTMGFVDAYRAIYPEQEAYTWWSTRGQARAKNVGWRIDYQVTSPEVLSEIINAAIYPEPLFSDHAPLMIEYQGGLV